VAQAFVERLARDTQKPCGHALIAVCTAQRFGDQRFDQLLFGLFECRETLGKRRYERWGRRWQLRFHAGRRAANRLFDTLQRQGAPLVAGHRIEKQPFQFAHVARST